MRALLTVLVLVSACGGTETVAPELASLRVNVTTSGIDVDRDGVLVSVDSAAVLIPANGTYLFVDVVVGSHTVQLSDAAANCTSNSALSRMIQVGAHSTTEVSFALTCTKVPLANSNLIAFIVGDTDQTFDLWLMNGDGTGATKLRDSPGVSEFAPAWSKDGQHVLFVRGTAIGRVDRTGGNYVELEPAAYYPSVSPDGQKIAFMKDATGSGSFDIWSMNDDGSNPQPLTVGGTYESHPRWSPDGSRIVFESGNDLYVMNADGSNAQRLTPPEVIEARSPSWSPDGTRIVFTRRGPEPAHIWTIKPDGTGLTQLTSGSDNDGGASWSADGSLIIFGSGRGSGGLWTMHPDGSGVRLLLSAPLFAGDAAWGP